MNIRRIQQYLAQSATEVLPLLGCLRHGRRRPSRTSRFRNKAHVGRWFCQTFITRLLGLSVRFQAKQFASFTANSMWTLPPGYATEGLCRPRWEERATTQLSRSTSPDQIPFTSPLASASNPFNYHYQAPNSEGTI